MAVVQRSLTRAGTQDRIAWRKSGSRAGEERIGTPTWLRDHVVHSCGQAMWAFNNAKASQNRPVFRCGSMKAGAAKSCGIYPKTIAIWKLQEVALDCLRADLTRATEGPSGAPLSAEAMAVRRLEQEKLTAPLAARLKLELMDRRQRLLERRQRAESLWLEGMRDRAWFDAQDGAVAEELAGVDEELGRLPTELGPQGAMEVARLVADAAERLLTEQRIPEPPELDGILRAFGSVVVGPSSVWIRYRTPYHSLLALDGTDGKVVPIPPTRGRGRDRTGTPPER